MRVTLAVCLSLALVLGCGESRETSPEEQQLARINRDLANMQQSVEAIKTRLDRLEGNRAMNTDAQTNRDATKPVTANDDPSLRAQALVDLMSKSSVATNPNALEVTIASDYRIDSKPHDETQLVAAFKAYVARVSSAQVSILAKRGSTHDMVVRVIDLAKQSGIDDFALNIDARVSPNAGAPDGIPSATPN